MTQVVPEERFDSVGSRGTRHEAFFPSPAPRYPSCVRDVLGRARYLGGDGCGIAFQT